MKLNTSKYDCLLDNNQNYMNYTALSFEGKKISYEEMHYNIEKYSKLLYQKGVREGDIIAVCALNTPESVYLLYALDKIGAIVVGLSPLDNKEKIQRDIEMTMPKMIITVDMNYANVKDITKALNISTITYSPLQSSSNLKLKFGYSLLQLKNGNFTLSRSSRLKYLEGKVDESLFVPKHEFTPGEVSDIMFTGGSTGVHKGVELCGSGLNYVCDGMNGIFDAGPGTIHLGQIPLGHMVYGRMIMHYSLVNNFEYALSLKAMPNDFYDEIVRTQSNCAVGGPPHWVSLIEKDGDGFKPSSKLKPDSLSFLRFATSGGEAKKESTVAAINEALEYCGSPTHLGDGLGATEAWSSIMICDGRLKIPNSIGEPIGHVNVKIVDPVTGLEVPDGEKGLLYVSGPTIMNGYFKADEETKKVISVDENGTRWYNSGDFVQKIGFNQYKYVGRQKRNFVCNVENIYPEELESILMEFPEIKEVIVVPKSDDMKQFTPVYYIYLSELATGVKELEQKIYDVVTTRLSENWLPSNIVYLDEPLIRMTNSKVDVNYYRELVEKQDVKKLEKSK